MPPKTSTKTAKRPLDVEEQKPARLPTVRKESAPAPAAPQPTSAMDLLRIVTERGATAEELGKYMDLMERQQDREAQQAFVRAMTAFKKVAPKIAKDAGAAFTAKGQEVAYDYATLGNICDKLIEGLAEHGISHDWDIQQPDSGMIEVTCMLTHEQGGGKKTTIKFPPDSSGVKNALQSIGSAVTYGERYSLLAVCGIAVREQGDDDGRAAGGSGNGQRNAPQRQQESNPSSGMHAIDGVALQRALAAIKRHDYTYAELIGYYRLTDAQLALVRAELNIIEGSEA